MQNLLPGGKSIDRFYDSAARLGEGDDTVFDVTMIYPDFVYGTCDDYIQKTPESTYRDLTFKTNGFSTTVSLLFAKMLFTFNWDASQITGKVTTYKLRS